MGYQEKRTWIVLLSQIVVYGTYFWILHHRHMRLYATVHVVLGTIVLQIILQSGLALTVKPQHRDERDRAIERSGYRAGYVALVIALVAVMAAVVHQFAGPVLHVSFLVNALLSVLGIAEVIRLATEVALYRRYA